MNIDKWLLDNNYNLIDQKIGDVNGDGISDIICLVSSSVKDSNIPLYDIRFAVFDGNNQNVYEIILPNNSSGYNPNLFVGSFTDRIRNDIFISIGTGDSGYFYYYLYSFINNQPKLIFDTKEFNNAFDYSVIYRDEYTVEVINQTLRRDFIIGIVNRDDGYLDNLYDSTGELIEPTKGEVLPLNNLYPINILNNGLYQFCATNKVIGLYETDTLGYIITLFYWGIDRYKIIDNAQYLSIAGTSI
jgi:hypothetical protein